MVKRIKLDSKPCTLQVVIQTQKRTKVWIKINDAKKPLTYYSKRYAFVDGEKTYYIRLPQAPDYANVIVYADGDKPTQKSASVKVRGINIVPLTVNPIQVSKRTKAFIKFAQEFCEEASYLEASAKGEAYYSDNGKFKIVYYPVIRSHNTNRMISTPARISQINGRIEISKESFLKMSVPMRMAILLHEFAHFYLNVNPSSEVESDLNAISIYLALGYPRIDAYNVFLNVFKKANSKQSLKRFKKLDNFIKQYEYERKN